MTWNKAGLLKIINLEREDMVPDPKELAVSWEDRHGGPQLQSEED